MENNHILYACKLNGDGTSALLEETQISKAIGDEAKVWVHLEAEHPQSRRLLEREFPYLDSLVIDALCADETRPRILEFDYGALLILRGVNLNPGAEPNDMVSIRLWVDKNYVISLRRRKLKAVLDIQARLKIGKGPKNSGDFVTILIASLFERMEPIFSEIDEKLDNVEESVMENPDTKERQEITSIRKDAIMFKRYIAPQRDVIASLRVSDQPWLDQMHKRRLQEALDRVIRYVEDIDMMRERAQIVKDELVTGLSDRLNKNMYMLSIVTAIFLPLGFLTGLLGINVGGIPGAENDAAFWIFMGMLGFIIGVQVWLFKKLKWF
ncbi:MAG: zinc transporter ZntB [Cycloclasticus sp.]|jgi:zinc transporter|nr:zinc transporter ZntB [Cycloclasticus sp.]MEE4291059.1 zinc transporter ZntB [Cycloclasticus sp.]